MPGLPLTALEERGLVVREAAGRRQELRLAHPVYGEVVRSAMPSIRRRRHHRELAAAVEDCGARRRDDVLRLATWSLDSSGTVAPERLVEAAEQAQRRFDLPLAQRLAEAAVDAGGGPPAFVLLAEVSFRRGELDRAVGLLARAADLAETDEHVASVADARAHVLDLSGRPGEAWEVLEEAQGRVSTPELVESLAGRAAVLMLFAGRMPEALAAVSRILAAVGGDRGALAPRQRLRCDYVEPIALALSGRGDEAVEVSTAGIAWLVASDVPYPVENLLIGRVLAHLLSGDLAAAAEDAVAVERGFVAAGDVEGEATGRLLQGRVELARGDLAAARAHFEHAVALNRRLDDRIGLRWSLGGLAAATGMAGDDAGPVAAELTAIPGDPAWLFEPDLVARGLAWTARAEGRGRDAVVVAAAAADEAARRGQVLPELTLRHDLLRWGQRDQAVRPVLWPRRRPVRGPPRWRRRRRPSLPVPVPAIWPPPTPSRRSALAGRRLRRWPPP